MLLYTVGQTVTSMESALAIAKVCCFHTYFASVKLVFESSN